MMKEKSMHFHECLNVPQVIELHTFKHKNKWEKMFKDKFSKSIFTYGIFIYRIPAIAVSN